MGLAVSMSVGLVLIGVLADVLSYDIFHKKHDRIYRVISRYEYLGDKGNNFMATTSLKSARLIKEGFAGVEEVAILRGYLEGDLQTGERIIPLKGFWANPAIFNVFSFELEQGNSNTALEKPFSLVLTQTSAKKLFGDEEALGKTVILNKDRSYTVTGILKDIPFFSHIKFDMLGSLDTQSIIEKDNWQARAWDDIWSTGCIYYYLQGPISNL